MAIALVTLRVSAEFDAPKYVSPAELIVKANDDMVQSARRVNSVRAQADASVLARPGLVNIAPATEPGAPNNVVYLTPRAFP
jgi:hypothetical protein